MLYLSYIVMFVKTKPSSDSFLSGYLPNSIGPAEKSRLSGKKGVWSETIGIDVLDDSNMWNGKISLQDTSQIVGQM